MKVWWCDEHKCASRDSTWCVKSVHPSTPMVLTPMRLVPEQSVSLDGEDGCERCGGPNIVSWFVESELWNLATGDERHLMLCPQCFVTAWAERTGLGDKMVWELKLDLPA